MPQKTSKKGRKQRDWKGMKSGVRVSTVERARLGERKFRNAVSPP